LTLFMSGTEQNLSSDLNMTDADYWKLTLYVDA